MPAAGKRSSASMKAEPTMPKTWVTSWATSVSTRASEGPIFCGWVMDAPLPRVSSGETVCLAGKHILQYSPQEQYRFLNGRGCVLFTGMGKGMTRRALSLALETGEVASETSSTLKALRVLEVLVRARRAVTPSELVQATELPTPTLHRTLALLEDAVFPGRGAGGRP